MSDSFAGAGLLIAPATGLSVTVTGTNSAATTEGGEPQPSCAPVTKTIWYRVSAGGTGVLTVSTAGSGFDTVVAVYTGSALNALTELICDDDAIAPGGASRVSVAASAGQTFAVQVGGYAGSTDAGPLQVSVTLDTSRTAPEPTVTLTPFPTSMPYPTWVPLPTQTAIASPAATGTPKVAAASDPAFVASRTATRREAEVTSAGAVATGGAQAPPLLATRTDPVTVPVSAMVPSATQLLLATGYPVTIGFDASAIAALQTLLPASSQMWITLDPAPVVFGDVQLGRLGGGVASPVGGPVFIGVSVKDSTGAPVTLAGGEGLAPFEALAALRQVPVTVVLPVAPHIATPGATFAWLLGVSRGGEFRGYLRPSSLYIPPATGAISDLEEAPFATGPFGAVRLRVTLDSLQGTLLLPVELVPAYVQSFDAEAHIFSGPFESDMDYGVAGPAFTIYTVVAPQVGTRLLVYNPTTQDYGWIDALKVGPVPPPE